MLEIIVESTGAIGDSSATTSISSVTQAPINLLKLVKSAVPPEKLDVASVVSPVVMLPL